MANEDIRLLDIMTGSIIDMLKRDTELVKLKWYKSEEHVPFNKDSFDLNEICGSVELDDETPGDIEHSGQTDRNYKIECRIIIYVPPLLRTVDTPTLNQFRQRIKKVFDDAEDGETSFPDPIIGYGYKTSYKRELNIPIDNKIKMIAKTVIHESILDYYEVKF